MDISFPKQMKNVFFVFSLHLFRVFEALMFWANTLPRPPKSYTPKVPNMAGWKIPSFDRTYILNWWSFHCHVSLRGGKMLDHSQRHFVGEVMSPYAPGSLTVRP